VFLFFYFLFLLLLLDLFALSADAIITVLRPFVCRVKIAVND